MKKLNTLAKASRKDAYKLVAMLRDGAELSDYELDRLYNYFSPARFRKEATILSIKYRKDALNRFM